MKSDREITLSRLQSVVTNGRAHFNAVDLRSSGARRFKDIVRSLTDALGGADNLSPQEKALVWKVSILQLWTELIEAKWLKRDTDEPPAYDIFKTYNRAVNSMRRIYRDLGLKGRVKASPSRVVYSQKQAEEYFRSRGINVDLSKEVEDVD